MLIPKITTYNTQIIPAMYQEWWQIVSIYDEKIFWHKEVKQSRTPKIAWDDFEEFWNLYPKERRKMKKQAKEVWARLDEKTKTLAIDWLKRYKLYWKRTNQDMNFVPTAYYWLKGERYNDEWLDSPSTNPVVDKLRQEIDQDKEIEKERKWNEQQLAKLKAEWKWESEYAKARDSLPEWQRKYERIIIAKMITNIRNP